MQINLGTSIISKYTNSNTIFVSEIQLPSMETCVNVFELKKSCNTTNAEFSTHSTPLLRIQCSKFLL